MRVRCGSTQKKKPAQGRLFQVFTRKQGVRKSLEKPGRTRGPKPCRLAHNRRTSVLPIAAAAPTTVGSQGYQIGEEHPGVHESDALFEARAALELGALELTFGRLTTGQLTNHPFG